MLFVGVWLVRLLFVLIDVLPVLVFFNGETTYDRLLTDRSTSAVRVYGEMLRTDERKATHRLELELELEQAEAEQEFKDRKAELDAARREHTARMNIRVRRAISRLESEMINSRVRAGCRPAVTRPRPGGRRSRCRPYGYVRCVRLREARTPT